MDVAQALRQMAWNPTGDSIRQRMPQESGGAVIGSENCLFLNVYAPHARKEHGPPLPVMVWIHGGGLIAESGEIFDPSPLVEQGNVIVVTINYRLGLLGFFAHPAIDYEGHPRGNYGLVDQPICPQMGPAKYSWLRRQQSARHDIRAICRRAERLLPSRVSHGCGPLSARNRRKRVIRRVHRLPRRDSASRSGGNGWHPFRSVGSRSCHGRRMSEPDREMPA